MDACEADLKRTRKELHSQEHLKYKWGTELDNLDVLAEDYDDGYEAVQLKIDEVYDRIEILEERIRKLKKRMEVLKKGVRSSDNIQKILDNFDLLFERMNCEERKELCRQFIERIDVFQEEREDGRILKRIVFRFPVYYGDCKGTRIRMPEENTVETVVLLSKVK